MSDLSARACPDCGAPLEPVTLFGRGKENPVSGFAEDATLHYAGPGATRSAMWAMFTPQGKVASLMCTGCRRILLYGVPDEDSSVH